MKFPIVGRGGNAKGSNNVPTLPIDVERLSIMVNGDTPDGVSPDNHAQAKGRFGRVRELQRQWGALEDKATQEIGESQQAIDAARSGIQVEATDVKTKVSQLTKERDSVGANFLTTARKAKLKPPAKPVGFEKATDLVRAKIGLPKVHGLSLESIVIGPIGLWCLKLFLILVGWLAVGQGTHAIAFHHLLRGWEGLKQAQPWFWYLWTVPLIIATVFGKVWFRRGYARGKASLARTTSEKNRIGAQTQSEQGYLPYIILVVQGFMDAYGGSMLVGGYNEYLRDMKQRGLGAMNYVGGVLFLFALSVIIALIHDWVGFQVARRAHQDESDEAQIGAYLERNPTAVEALQLAIKYDKLSDQIVALRKQEKRESAARAKANRELSKIPTQATMLPETARAFTTLSHDLRTIDQDIRKLMSPTRVVDVAAIGSTGEDEDEIEGPQEPSSGGNLYQRLMAESQEGDEEDGK